jgi:succinate-semialdehyde dehydrogenase/glutarate-semialdehyde dehydrogenase
VALEAAAAAFPGWRATLAKDRARLLRGWAARIEQNAEDLARIISREQGKPLAESRVEVAYGVGYLEWFAEEAKRAYGDIIPTPFEGRRLTAVPEPVGVVALITPWNLPFAMLARKVAPALAAGCTVVAKPAEDTPLTALAFAALGEEAGLPPGVVNVTPVSRNGAEAVVDVWLDDARVRKISFTGSTAVGRRLAARSVETLKRLSLELGGDAPFLVFADADIDQVVDGLMKAKFRNAGQTCIAPNRILVQAEVHDRFCERLVAAVRRLTVGSAAEGAFDIGPLIHARAAANVEGLVAEAVAAGARVLAGGTAHPRGGAFVAPTILDGVTGAMRVGCEEVFGPVIPIRTFDSEADAVAIANASPYGLAAYVFTSARRGQRIADALETGMVGVNEAIISTETAPFGGVKQSGYGREGSRHGLADYQALKYVCTGAAA